MMRIIFSVAMLTLCSGCGTILAHVDGSVTGPYSGVRCDSHLIASVGKEHDMPVFPWIIPLSIFDLPLSLATDTLLLPYDLTQPVTSPNSDAKK
jgi:uncharacterized protein YceK